MVYMQRKLQQKQPSCFVFQKASVDQSELKEYDGPMISFDTIHEGLTVEDLGLDVMIGTSTIPNAGLGLFLAVSDDVEETTITTGTPICGYSRGVFHTESVGTKCVGFAFDNPYRGIFFNKQLSSIFEVVTKKLPSEILNDPSFSVSDIIEGHTILWNEEQKEMKIFPDETYTKGRYFIPDETHEWTPGYFGMYANDLAYPGHDVDMTEKDYHDSAKDVNILQIVWRMELDKETKKLVPIWPVVICNQDLKFTNRLPMEVGLMYTWKYWEAARILAKEES